MFVLIRKTPTWQWQRHATKHFGLPSIGTFSICRYQLWTLVLATHEVNLSQTHIGEGTAQQDWHGSFFTAAHCNIHNINIQKNKTATLCRDQNCQITYTQQYLATYILLCLEL